MTYHILNGDALIERFNATGLKGEKVVARECLIEGDLHGDSLPEFYQTRAKHIEKMYGESQSEYYVRVVNEFEKLQAVPDGSEFNLWFGYDLFCCANMWFILSILNSLSIQKIIFAVYPSYLKAYEVWNDFGGATPEDLITCFNSRTPFDEAGLRLGADLWTAYKNADLTKLETLSKQPSSCFPYLHEVCKAHIERFPKNGGKGKPERVIEDIVQNTSSDFHTVFTEFFKREGIYGFGDAQVKQLYDNVLYPRR
jgi:hypothetical protein